MIQLAAMLTPTHCDSRRLWSCLGPRPQMGYADCFVFAKLASMLEIPGCCFFLVLGMVLLGAVDGLAGGDGALAELSIPSNPLIDSRDGKTYGTVRIGTQRWMAQNLDYAGTTDSPIGRCYGMDSVSCGKYGRLYTWNEAMDHALRQKSRGICPVGWRVPSDEEWTVLQDYVDESKSTDGQKLKASTGWFGGNGSDIYGFHALPGGQLVGGAFRDAGSFGMWWSATELDSLFAWSRGMCAHDPDVYRGDNNKKSGLSVRCIKDQEP
jgi:uncharacterized protein (TIGR02145 family)